MEIPGYKIIEQIGEGGMAQVYKGYQQSLKREVAIKVLSSSLLEQKGFKERFDKESLIVARLSNPYIIPIIERGISADGTPYFIMEYIEGTDLKEAMAADKFSFNQKLDICIQICKALSYAHQNGVIHRDIKPANILLDKQDNAKIMDFGIAQYYSEDIGSQKTQLGDMMGTVAYMSPEQYESAALVTSKSDIYSLGILMYRLFTNCEPLGRFKTPLEIDHKFPAELDKLIMDCLQTKPEDRPDSAETIKNKLLQLMGGAHLETEQKQRANTGIKSLALLDILYESGQMSVSLYENKSDNSLLIVHKRPMNYPGLQESKLLSKLQHKNIIKILGTSNNEQFYLLVTEYINGGTLQDRMLEALDWRHFLPLAKSITEALLFAHNNKIIHGDIRPSNILFDQKGKVIVAGFGLRNPEKSTVTRKSRYRVKNEKPSIQADIYALGVVFYQLLLRKLPPINRNYDTDKTTLLMLPLKFQKLLMQMLETSASNRPSSCLQVMRVLDEYLEQITHLEVEKTELQQASPSSRKPRSFKLLYGLILISIIAGGSYYFYPQIRSTTSVVIDKLSVLIDKFKKNQEPAKAKPVPNYIEF